MGGPGSFRPPNDDSLFPSTQVSLRCGLDLLSLRSGSTLSRHETGWDSSLWLRFAAKTIEQEHLQQITRLPGATIINLGAHTLWVQSLRPRASASVHHQDITDLEDVRGQRPKRE